MSHAFSQRMHQLQASLGESGRNISWDTHRQFQMPATTLTSKQKQALREEQAQLWLSAGGIRHNRQPFMAGVGKKNLQEHNANPRVDRSDDWQSRFMKKYGEEIETAEPVAPLSDKALEGSTSPMKFQVVADRRSCSREPSMSRFSPAPKSEAELDEDKENVSQDEAETSAEEAAEPSEHADVEVHTVADLQHILFLHDQMRAERGLESECRPLAADAVLRHAPPYKGTVPTSSLFTPIVDNSWGEAVLLAIQADDPAALEEGLSMAMADVEAVVENDAYETIGHRSRHLAHARDWERDSFGGCELFERNADGVQGVRGGWSGRVDHALEDGEQGNPHGLRPLQYEIGDTALLISIRNEKWNVAAKLANYDKNL